MVKQKFELCNKCPGRIGLGSGASESLKEFFELVRNYAIERPEAVEQNLGLVAVEATEMFAEADWRFIAEYAVACGQAKIEKRCSYG